MSNLLINFVFSLWYYNVYFISCYADNTSASQAYLFTDDELEGATLSSGKNTSGYLYYEVPENASSITLEYNYNVFTETKVIFSLK